jgi:hypothetical protein
MISLAAIDQRNALVKWGRRPSLLRLAPARSPLQLRSDSTSRSA